MKLIHFWHTTNPWTKVIGGFLLSTTLLLILSLFGWVHTTTVALALFPLFFGTVTSFLQLFHQKDWWRIGIIFGLISVAIFNLSGEAPSIFSGRDQGSIALAAWELAQNGQLHFSSPVIQSFFAIYGNGTALNFPGFTYTKDGFLLTQFPLGYIAWLAGFVGWLGLVGFHVANTILFTLAGWTFFEIASRIVRHPLALIGTLLFSLSFLPIWILHFTLSEHLALVLFLSLSLGLIELFKEPSRKNYVLIFLSASLFIFTRIEGFILFPLTFLIIFLIPTTRTWLMHQPKAMTLFLPSILLGFIFLRDFFINLPFYTVMAKVIIKEWHVFSSLGATAATGTTAYQPENFLSVVSHYHLGHVFLVGTAGLLFAYWKRHRATVIIFVLALPTFIYLLDANITPDHPWMLRRYYFTLWPAFILGFLFLWHIIEEHISKLKSRVGLLSLTLILVILHATPASTAWRLDEYSHLYETTLTLADRLTGRDLILVDRLASGSPFHLLAGPLHSILGKQAVYFFNPEDLQRLDLKSYERVFFIGSQSSKKNLEKKSSFHFEERTSLNFILPSLSTGDSLLPRIRETKTNSSLFELIPSE